MSNDFLMRACESFSVNLQEGEDEDIFRPLPFKLNYFFIKSTAELPAVLP